MARGNCRPLGTLRVGGVPQLQGLLEAGACGLDRAARLFGVAVGDRGPGAGEVALPAAERSEVLGERGQAMAGDELPALPQVAFLSSLAPEAFVELGHAMVYLRARAGDVIFSKGDDGDSCLVISRGRAVAVQTEDKSSEVSEEIVLKELGPGDFAGVFGLVVDKPRQATLRAKSDLEYFEIDRVAIRSLIQRHPSTEVRLRVESR